MGASLEAKRRYMEEQLKELGFGVMAGNGAYFIIADVRCERACGRGGGGGVFSPHAACKAWPQASSAWADGLMG